MIPQPGDHIKRRRSDIVCIAGDDRVWVRFEGWCGVHAVCGRSHKHHATTQNVIVDLPVTCLSCIAQSV